jgi:hypothetical protein
LLCIWVILSIITVKDILISCDSGIVRGIDTVKGMLYVITPVPYDSLKKVNLLLQGYIQIPTHLMKVRNCVLYLFLLLLQKKKQLEENKRYHVKGVTKQLYSVLSCNFLIICH